MNFLVRICCARVFLISSVSESLLFYLYGSTIAPTAEIHCPLRFSHSRSIVIGGGVVFNPAGFAYIFNNVTIGKSSPMDRSESMPAFKGRSFFGVGSVVLGDVVSVGDVVFGANAFASNIKIPSSSSVIGFGQIRQGVFFDDVEYPFLPVRCDRLSRLFSLKYDS